MDHVYETKEGVKKKITVDDARKIYFQLIKHNYINDAGKLTEAYYEAKKNNTFVPWRGVYS